MNDIINTIFSLSITVLVGAIVFLVMILFALVSICVGGVRSRLRHIYRM